jgi:hypothetical protein
MRFQMTESGEGREIHDKRKDMNAKGEREGEEHRKLKNKRCSENLHENLSYLPLPHDPNADVSNFLLSLPFSCTVSSSGSWLSSSSSESSASSGDGEGRDSWTHSSRIYRPNRQDQRCKRRRCRNHLPSGRRYHMTECLVSCQI